VVNADNASDFNRWQEWGRWKLSFMDAAWKLAAFGIREVRPDFLPVTQSVYGWPAYADGYYFNVVRSLPVINGHGGYDDYGGAYFNPSYTFEFGRARDLHKPNWYLPTWYGGMPSDRFRLEQYLSFMNNLQGMMKPPDMTIHRPSTTPATADGIVESNKLMARLGTIFTTMPVTRPPVAVLYSLSQDLYAQAHDMKDNYTGGRHAREKTFLAYLAGKVSHIPLFPIVEEDITDGTLAANHKAVLLPGINYLDPKVIVELERFAASGGLVLVSDDSAVEIKGATKLGCTIDVTLYDRIAKFYEQKKTDELARVNNAGSYLNAVQPIARALKMQCAKHKIMPVLECDNPSIIVSRQAEGDVEYLFAVNASYDEKVGGMNALKTAQAKLEFPADGRPVYDAVLGGPVRELQTWLMVRYSQFRFGPGQMRVFARTARAIGGVQLSRPRVRRDYTVQNDPLHLDISAVVLDDKGHVVAGSVPLEIRVSDPLGATRYHLYRATDQGSLRLTLPLAVNDPPGTWGVTVHDLLANTEDTGYFVYRPVSVCGAAAGATPRAVSFGNDRANIFRFFRNHHDVTVAVGSSGYNTAAAERLAAALKPWDVRCKIVKAADVNRPRAITEEEAKTWCGLEPGKVQPGHGNNPAQVGFDVRGSVILLGTPEDNPLIQFLQKEHFLPYQPDKASFPGAGRGMLAWQRDGVGYEQESITLIAYDADGMAEAVGSLYEAAAGLDPLTKWGLPSVSSIRPATKDPGQVPELPVAWKATLPDRVAGLKVGPHGPMILTEDGSLTWVDTLGLVSWKQPLNRGESCGETWALDMSPDGNTIAAGASHQVAAFDGKRDWLFDMPAGDGKTVPPILFVAVAPDGKSVAWGTADGKLSLFSRRGKRLWSIGGVDPKDKNARPNPYLSGTFTADGKALVALTANEMQVFAVADGKKEAAVPGIKGAVAPQRAGTGVLVTDGRTVRLQAAKEIRRVDLGDAGVIAVAPAGVDLVVGTETDGTVRKFGAGPAPVWQHRVAGHVVKKLAVRGDQTAVAYWGGLVHLLDADGSLKAVRRFPQDVTALDWFGDKLLVGLANGEVLALKTSKPGGSPKSR
jgi:hypothetical protein